MNLKKKQKKLYELSHENCIDQIRVEQNRTNRK